jgi:hypothetical protein
MYRKHRNSLKTSETIYSTTRCHIPEDLNFQKQKGVSQIRLRPLQSISFRILLNHPTIWRQKFRLQTASLNIHRNIRRIVQRTTEILNNHTCIPLKCKTNHNIFTKGEERGGESSGRRRELGMQCSDRQYIYYYGGKQETYCSDGSQKVSARPSDKDGLGAR